MRVFIALLTGALFICPGLAAAQTASPSPQPSASASAAASASPAPAPASSASPAPSAPVDTPVISVPHNWIEKQYTMNMGSFTMLNMWYRPNGAGDNINLGYSPNPAGMDLARVVPIVRMGLERMLGAGNVTDHAEKVCRGTADGWLFHGKVTMGTYNMTIDEVILVSKHDVFGATYTRHSSHPQDPAARKALDTLCVKA